MLRQMENLPPNVVGIKAEGTVTAADYQKTYVPILEEAYRAGRQIRLIYQLGPQFTGFTSGGAWEDFRVGVKYLRLYEKCAIVTDVDWIRNAAEAFGSFFPCPTRIFRNDQLGEAMTWAANPENDSKLTYELTDNGVLTVHPHGPLRREDFDKLASMIDPWVEAHHQLNGLVISMKKFPGWENFGSMVQHFEFVRGHHRKVRKVALAVDGLLPELASQVAKHFVEAEVKTFPFHSLPEAKAWASR